MTNEEIIKTIRESMDRCRARGVRIGANGWGVFLKEDGTFTSTSLPTCPLGAVLVCGPEEVRARAKFGNGYGYAAAAATALEVSIEWTFSFLFGVDGKSPIDAKDSEAYEIGAKFREMIRLYNEKGDAK